MPQQPVPRPQLTNRRHLVRWRYLAHRTGLVCSPSLLYRGVPFSTARHRRRILARKENAK
ncbi:hypothetical protein [Streptomyces sp. NPDC048489]|uniref:hypothetical protein n=1 Tax=Streptomyces sp. NPDC048489 TaxID=3154504 RepID=UPI00341AB90D